MNHPSPAPEAMLTLKEACDVFFGGNLTPEALRATLRRGSVRIIRAGKSDWVSPAAIREFLECQDEPKAQDSISTPSSAPGSSETGRSLDAQAAAKAIAQQLTKHSQRTSPKNSSQPSAKVISLKSRSQKC